MSILRSCLCWYVFYLIFVYSFSNFCKPKAHSSIFRTEVKDHCVVAVMLAIDTQNSLAAIARFINTLLDDFNCIFPRQSKVSPHIFGKHLQGVLK
jgi:hypothetical protein